MSAKKVKKTVKKAAAKKVAKKTAAKKARTVAKATRSEARKSTGTYRPRLSNDAVIRITVDEVPYRQGSDAAIHFAAMKGGITVGSYMKKFDKDVESHRKARQWLWNVVRDGNAKVLGA